MSLIATALTSLEDVKAFLQLRASKDNTELETLINVVSTHVVTYTRRNIIEATYTDEAHDGDNTPFVLVDEYPINSVASIVTHKDATPLTVLGTDFAFDAKAGEIKLINGQVFPRSYREALITYVAGFLLANVPLDLVHSVIKAVAFLYQEQTKKSYNVTRQEFAQEGGAAEYIEQLYPKLVLDIWKRFRKKIVG